MEVIPDNAFYKSKITSINIPKTVTKIGDCAFYCCTELGGTLILPENLLLIGRAAFAGDYHLTPESNPTNIHNQLSSTLIIPNSVYEIKASAFHNCRKLTGIILSTSLTMITEYCCSHCSGFTGNLGIPDQVTKLSLERSIGAPNSMQI